MNQAEAKSAVAAGVRRAKCRVISLRFDGIDLVATIESETGGRATAREYHYDQFSVEQLEIRFYRFALHFAVGTPFQPKLTTLPSLVLGGRR